MPEPTVKLKQPLTTILPGNKVATNALKKIRLEWQEVNGNGSLIKTYASVGLLLVDVCKELALNEHDTRTVLGDDLYLDLKTIL